MTSANTPLTVAMLKKLPFRFAMHMNMGSEHARVRVNDEYDLSICTVVRKRGYKVVSRTLTANRLPDDYICDLLSTNLDDVLAGFVDLYNAAATEIDGVSA